MEEYIYRPIGMTRTSMVWEDRFQSDYANGYDEQGKSLGPEKRTKGEAAGSMQTTLHDYAQFVQAVLMARFRMKKFTPLEWEGFKASTYPSQP